MSAKDHHPLLYKWSKVKTFPHEASQVKKPTFGSTQEFQITHVGKYIEFPNSKAE